ncbi:MAG: hypothetical protein OCD76_04385 [Reichenbachiella sp.]
MNPLKYISKVESLFFWAINMNQSVITIKNYTIPILMLIVLICFSSCNSTSTHADEEDKSSSSTFASSEQNETADTSSSNDNQELITETSSENTQPDEESSENDQPDETSSNTESSESKSDITGTISSSDTDTNIGVSENSSSTPSSSSLQSSEVESSSSTVAFSSIAIEAPESILFVGNSLVYTNDLDNMVKEMFAASGRSLTTATRVPGGETMCGHAGTSETMNEINSGNYDVVVFQGHSWESYGSDQIDDFLNCGSQLYDAANEAGSTVYFYQTWRNMGGPENMIHTISLSYQSLSEQNNDAPVIPCGRAFDVVDQEKGFEFLRVDDIHPTWEGTYLAASTFYGALTGESPVDNTYTADISDASYYQTIAWEMILEYGPTY